MLSSLQITTGLDETIRDDNRVIIIHGYSQYRSRDVFTYIRSAAAYHIGSRFGGQSPLVRCS